MSHESKYYSNGDYEVDHEGKLYYLQPLKNAEGVSLEPIANHAPMVIRIVHKKDGFTETEVVEHSARRNYKLESPVYIDKKTMISSQPQILFSPACRIYPGRGHVTRYSEFMQMQCEDAKIETIYMHTGWITNDYGERVFLNGSHCIDKNGLNNEYSVELDSDFQHFQFYPVEDDIDECFDSVISKFQKLVPDKIGVPLLAYMFLTPLNDLLRHKGKEPCFSLYLIGKTGCYKSSISKLLLCFWGKFNYADTSPITFLDTQNAIGRKLAVGSDIPLLLDDRRPTNNNADKLRYEGIEKYVSSAIGDRAARGRLNADSTAKVSYVAKSNLIVTAEEAFVNIGSSSIARSISIELEPDTVNFAILQELQEKPQHFNKVMQLYIQWIINNYDMINDSSEDILKKYRLHFCNEGHARLATSFSQLMLGYLMYLLFLSEYGQLQSEDVNSIMDNVKRIFLDMCNNQSKRVDSEKPTVLFIELLKEMLETKRVSLIDLRNQKQIGNSSVNIPSLLKNSIGYRDNNYIYLIPQVTYNEICTFYGIYGV